ncbi:restriction endonuclease subunit S [Bilifractor sp. LCP19S3_H10]|uniref:restriction endonuclease subunit S n=1 Tax=Bilifractor sp. LCP19S3_H10 TaxID=3438736 RepID=UPI003F9357D3
MKIKELLLKIIDNRGKTPPTTEEGYDLIEINSIAGVSKYPDYSLIKKHVSKETYLNWFRAGHPQIGDILIPTVGTLNAIGYMDRNDCCIAQNLIALRVDPEICDSQYLYYLLCWNNVRQRLLNLDIGAVQPSIKVPHLKNLEVKVPDLRTQKKIGTLLNVFDEKIKKNDEINKNLYAA